jgi:hypothetical protein
MRLGYRLKIVGFIRVAEHSVGQRGVDCGSHDVRRKNGGLGCAALTSHVTNGHLAGLQPRSGNHGRQRIQDMVLAVSGCLRRQVSFSRFHHVPRQPADEIGGWRPLGTLAPGKGQSRRRSHWPCRGRDESTRSLQDAPPRPL